MGAGMASPAQLRRARRGSAAHQPVRGRSVNQREKDHTMSKYKKADRVRGKHSHKPGIIVGPDSGDAYEVITDDGVQRRWLTQDIELDDPAPLRFEDVRDGDTITVEGEDYSITGSSWTEPGDPPRVTVGGVTIFNFNGDEGTHGPYGPPVRLTAHTRADHKIEPPYQVGDPDPTLGAEPSLTCNESIPNDSGWHWYCTWQPGHTGDHVAGNGERVCAVWPQTPPVPVEDLRAPYSRGLSYPDPKEH